MAQLEVDLVAADRKVWSGTAKQVSAPAAEGEIGILAGHSPLLSALRAGRVSITAADGSAITAGISGGFLSVDEDAVTIVVDSADLDVSIGSASR
ncbi:F0F1 ATP synthase subunit epsilon [Sanguibacter suaedae]|uniref:ATP synthase epsilon chain n=1 Tax=Sanguibacter suaedae TaxID=2795737 RepID=A0A934MAT5_9MICO|nr:F0F1 ATP synthase subunit epsilon [Sanguibacter suaedae]MBI9116128.1 F0F1 ATP synthase subunit epsilon [Sanguibacter suaedae]